MAERFTCGKLCRLVSQAEERKHKDPNMSLLLGTIILLTLTSYKKMVKRR